MTFEEWLNTATKRDGSPLAKRTIKHYADGFRITSKEMLELNVIDKPLENMNMYELDLAISLIMKNKTFIDKDEVGNKMYSNALKRYRCFKYLNTDLGIQEAAEEAIVKNDSTLTVTEKETIVKARRGQGSYRDKLIKKYNHSCIMTKVSISQVLVASHIKPWAICDNKERVDVNNGLLLSATYDRLFDSGLITFDKDGKLKISKLISKDNADRLEIKSGTKYDIKYCNEMKNYLDYHNNVIFVG